jgi:hypothetical protein
MSDEKEPVFEPYRGVAEMMLGGGRPLLLPLRCGDGSMALCMYDEGFGKREAGSSPTEDDLRLCEIIAPGITLYFTTKDSIRNMIATLEHALKTWEADNAN